MSGGSLNYLYLQIEDYADALCDRELIELANDMAKIFKDAEWWHSADIGEEAYRESVQKFKNKWFNASEREKRLGKYIQTIFEEGKKECIQLIGAEKR